MPSQAQVIENNTPQSVTTISANARVDYILRFSKHAVLVVDHDVEVYSQVASQFLASLANDHNAAFVAISPKLDDIQIRCRIIEQLFADSLFDPEQSLAVSLINLAKQEKQAIDIVIEHAQFLSLQILHELCQLTDISKKANYQISVLMLGTPESGIALANNKTLFHQKISVLSGQTGQLLSLNAKIFKVDKSFFKVTPFAKWMLALLGFVLLLGFGAWWLLQQDVFSLKTKANLEQTSQKTTSLITAFKKPITNVPAEATDIFTSLTNLPQAIPENLPTIPREPAAAIDIVSAIVSLDNESSALLTKAENSAKRVNDLNDKVSFTDAKIASQVGIPRNSLHNENSQKRVDISDKTDVIAVNNDVKNKEITKNDANGALTKLDEDIKYYTSLQSGFVIQIAGFTSISAYQSFLPDFEEINAKRYYRLFNQQPMLMVTSEVFDTRTEAEQALVSLPSAIKVNQPWIKSIEAINSEINAYQRSQ